ncbi:MAG: hypothetical protein OCD76_14295 [Reichenbachiella sp.]
MGIHRETQEFSVVIEGVSVYSMVEGVKGELWLACSKQLIRLNTNEQYNYEREDGLSSVSVNTIFKDSEGGIWAGTKNGLNIYDRSTNSFEAILADDHKSSSLSNNVITTIAQDLQGRIWVGTIDGLNCLEDRNVLNFIRFDKNKGLPDNVISNMVLDENHDIWLTTNKGLSKISLEESNDANLKVRSYDLRDGLQGYEFNLNASLMGANGQLYFGGANGYNSFTIDQVRDSEVVPDIVFTSFKIFN